MVCFGEGQKQKRGGGERRLFTVQPFSIFFPTPTSTCSAAPPAAEILKGLPLNCQSVLFSYKRSFCHLHSFYCLARQLTAQPRSSLLFPEPRAGAQTAGEQPQQRKVTPLCRWRPRFISNINLHEHCGRPKRRDVRLACCHWNLTVSWLRLGIDWNPEPIFHFSWNGSKIVCNHGQRVASFKTVTSLYQN